MNRQNRGTRVTASTFGALLGMAGIVNHGIFEVLRKPAYYQRNRSDHFKDILQKNKFWYRSVPDGG